jgi:hypothetical protein
MSVCPKFGLMKTAGGACDTPGRPETAGAGEHVGQSECRYSFRDSSARRQAALALVAGGSDWIAGGGGCCLGLVPAESAQGHRHHADHA